MKTRISQSVAWWRSVFLGALIFLLLVSNLALNLYLQQRVKISGQQLAEQVELLGAVSKPVLAALAQSRGFTLPEDNQQAPQTVSLVFSSFHAGKTRLLLAYRPVWLSGSHFFIILNLILLGVSGWGYHRYRLSRLSKGTENKDTEKERQSVNITAEDILNTHNEDGDASSSGQLCLNLFALIEWRCTNAVSNTDMDAHLQLILAKGFPELPRPSAKCLQSGVMTVTLSKLNGLRLDSYLARLQTAFHQAGRNFRADMSRKDVKIGCCSFTSGADQAAVYQLALSALASAKQSAWQHIHRTAFDRTQSQLFHLSSDEIKDALERKQFVLFFQPLFDFTCAEIISHEALLRVRHKSLGLLNGGQFLPLLADDEVIRLLDQTVVEQVLNLLDNEVSVTRQLCINLHAGNWFNPAFWCWLILLLEERGRLDFLVFELSEAQFCEHENKLVTQFAQLRRHDIGIFLDQVNGRLEAAHLQHDINGLKLDCDLVRGCDKDIQRQGEIKRIVKLAGEFDIPVYGVGVETQTELECLLRLGVLAGQGFYFSEPMYQFDDICHQY